MNFIEQHALLLDIMKEASILKLLEVFTTHSSSNFESFIPLCLILVLVFVVLYPCLSLCTGLHLNFKTAQSLLLFFFFLQCHDG